MSLLLGLGLVCTSLVSSGTAQADEVDDSKAKASAADKPADAADDSRANDSRANDSKAKDGKAKDGKVDKKADVKAEAKTADAKSADAPPSDEDGDKAKTALKGGGDDGAEEKPEPSLGARLPWRGTSVGWSNTASASAIGIGQDYNGDDFHVASMTFSAVLNYYVLDEDVYSVRITASPSFAVELTNGATTTRREPQFNDLPVTVTLGGINFYKHDELPISLGAITRARIILPTSPASQNNGTILGTTLGGTAFLSLPLAYEADVFKSILIFSGFNYDHRFSRATTPVNNDLARPRQDGAGLPLLSDQLGGGRISAPRLRESIGIFVSENLLSIDWQLFAGFSFQQQFLDDFDESACVAADTGCAPVGAPPEAQETLGTRTLFGSFVGLGVFPWPELGINLGYSHNANTNGPDGTRESIINSPTGSSVSAGVTFSVDALYERATGPKRSSPFVLF